MSSQSVRFFRTSTVRLARTLQAKCSVSCSWYPFNPRAVSVCFARDYGTKIEGPARNPDNTKRPSSSVVRKLKRKESSLGLGVPLTTGQLNKKRHEKETKTREGAGFLEVAAYGIAQQVDLEALRLEFKKEDTYKLIPLPVDLNQEVLLISTNCDSHSTDDFGDVFIFRSGSIVFWNISESQHRVILNRVRRFCQEILPSQLVEREDLQYKFTEGPTCLIGEDIYLQTQESRPPAARTTMNESISSPYHRTSSEESHHDQTASDTPPITSRWLHLVPIDDPIRMEQFALSDALALSVKLSLLENRFDAVAVQMEPWIEDMKRGVRTSFSRSSVLKKTGELFTLRHLLNVSTSMIEMPDFYWDRPEIEGLHDQLRSILSISARTRVLNSRLNMCCELTQILANHLQSRHASHLEWMIIVLILVEVCFEASHYYHNRRQEREMNAVLGSVRSTTQE